MFILYFSDQTGFTGQVCFNTASRSDVKGRKVWWDEYENCKKGLSGTLAVGEWRKYKLYVVWDVGGLVDGNGRLDMAYVLSF